MRLQALLLLVLFQWSISSHVAVLDAVESQDPCGGAGVTISGSSSGFVASPNFPNNFDPQKICVWTITVPSGRVKLSFLNFTLEKGQNTYCSGPNFGGASLIITNVASDDGRSPFRLCGQSIPDPVYSDTSSIQITLITSTNALPGFNASYETVTNDMLCPRALNVTKLSGVISSPFYPRKYPVNQNCFWEITASKGKHVKLEITDMQIHRCGSEGACTCDYLEIRHGFLGSSLTPGAASGKLCVDDSFTPQTYYSTNERLSVRFFADRIASKQHRGFTATYTQLNFTPPECPSAAIQLSGNGSFSSLKYPVANYPSGRTCFWIITASLGKRVKVQIIDFQMGLCDDCSSNICSRLEFYDGPTANSSSLGRLCTNSELTAMISSGNQMFVKFYSSFTPDRGFLAEYSESHEPPSPTSTHTSSPTMSTSWPSPWTMPTPWSSPTRPRFAFTISCFPTAMVAHIARDSLPLRADASLLHLNDPSCGVNYVTKNSVIIKAPLKGCGTVRRNIGYKVSFHNKLVVPFRYGNKRSLSVFPFKCVYSHFGFP